jgi:hypothetical protein
MSRHFSLADFVEPDPYRLPEQCNHYRAADETERGLQTHSPKRTYNGDSSIVLLRPSPGIQGVSNAVSVSKSTNGANLHPQAQLGKAVKRF